MSQGWRAGPGDDGWQGSVVPAVPTMPASQGRRHHDHAPGSHPLCRCGVKDRCSLPSATDHPAARLEGSTWQSPRSPEEGRAAARRGVPAETTTLSEASPSLSRVEGVRCGLATLHPAVYTTAALPTLGLRGSLWWGPSCPWQNVSVIRGLYLLDAGSSLPAPRDKLFPTLPSIPEGGQISPKEFALLPPTPPRWRAPGACHASLA